MKLYFLFILVLLLDTIQAGIAEKVQIYSASMEKNIPDLVVFPDNYAESELHLNTILLLHWHGYLSIRKHPELFSSSSNMSSGVDLRHFMKRWGIAQKLGPYKKFPHRWEQYSIVGTEFPSAHTWEYWVHALDYHFYYLQHQFKYP